MKSLEQCENQRDPTTLYSMFKEFFVCLFFGMADIQRVDTKQREFCPFIHFPRSSKGWS